MWAGLCVHSEQGHEVFQLLHCVCLPNFLPQKPSSGLATLTADPAASARPWAQSWTHAAADSGLAAGRWPCAGQPSPPGAERPQTWCRGAARKSRLGEWCSPQLWSKTLQGPTGPHWGGGWLGIHRACPSMWEGTLYCPSIWEALLGLMTPWPPAPHSTSLPWPLLTRTCSSSSVSPGLVSARAACFWAASQLCRSSASCMYSASLRPSSSSRPLQ